MNDLRRNGIVGIIEIDGLQPTSMHVAEWWNGEGFDVCFDDGEVMKLHLTQLQALVTLALATEFVDLEEAQALASDIVRESEKRQQRIDNIRDGIKKKEEENERRRNIKVVHETFNEVKQEVKHEAKHEAKHDS